MLAIDKLEYIETHIAFLSCFNLMLYFEQFPISKTNFQKHNFAIAERTGQTLRVDSTSIITTTRC